MYKTLLALTFIISAKNTQYGQTSILQYDVNSISLIQILDTVKFNDYSIDIFDVEKTKGAISFNLEINSVTSTEYNNDKLLSILLDQKLKLKLDADSDLITILNLEEVYLSYKRIYIGDYHCGSESDEENLNNFLNHELSFLKVLLEGEIETNNYISFTRNGHPLSFERDSINTKNKLSFRIQQSLAEEFCYSRFYCFEELEQKYFERSVIEAEDIYNNLDVSKKKKVSKEVFVKHREKYKKEEMEVNLKRLNSNLQICLDSSTSPIRQIISLKKEKNILTELFIERDKLSFTDAISEKRINVKDFIGVRIK